MVSHLFFYQLVLIALVWLCVMLQWAWPSDPAAACPTTLEPQSPRPKRHREPTPFAGIFSRGFIVLLSRGFPVITGFELPQGGK